MDMITDILEVLQSLNETDALQAKYIFLLKEIVYRNDLLLAGGLILNLALSLCLFYLIRKSK